jgi:hypothetical protein
MAETRPYIDAERATRAAWARVYHATIAALALEAVLKQRVTAGDLQESLAHYQTSMALLGGADVVIRQAAQTTTTVIQAVQTAGAAQGFNIFPGVPVPPEPEPEEGGSGVK